MSLGTKNLKHNIAVYLYYLFIDNNGGVGFMMR